MTTATEQSTSHSGLISSSDVNGTAVYSPSGDHIGEIDHLMIDKVSGKIGYAVMGFGGFLGIGEDHMAIPWAKLHYDRDRGGYVSDITKEQVEGLPLREDDWARDRDWEKQTYSHFGLPYYWL
ncbi:PRC-barrel domain-containing protein [Oceaniovalibus sp. ACAM 378]|jgi:sporulation protein YlmC with PRC-barrel domain|uniref:PRC-barrel domain-containing protein n=1 Tax=Oceaniovalibus sp. ACAM 378 TaxID=2599923 RepID=UPI0011D62353|nr:PRC-barrel domain-containing protein [Oceaniovalibus sp. ACAM 378]TYB88563.1 PRC-barrel domain containing protein [Oceaniovalibus sp. ACAM 378]